MKVLVVSCHPLDDSYTAHLWDRAVAVLSAVHDVLHHDLYRGGDDLNLDWAEALVLVYPTWWSSLPAPLVDWVDRKWSQRHRYPELRHITVVTAHGSSKWVNLIEGEVGRRIVVRGLRRRAHPRCTARWISLYNIDRSTPEQRKRFVERVERKLARLG